MKAGLTGAVMKVALGYYEFDEFGQFLGKLKEQRFLKRIDQRRPYESFNKNIGIGKYKRPASDSEVIFENFFHFFFKIRSVIMALER